MAGTAGPALCRGCDDGECGERCQNQCDAARGSRSVVAHLDVRGECIERRVIAGQCKDRHVRRAAHLCGEAHRSELDMRESSYSEEQRKEKCSA